MDFTDGKRKANNLEFIRRIILRHGREALCLDVASIIMLFD